MSSTPLSWTSYPIIIFLCSLVLSTFMKATTLLVALSYSLSSSSSLKDFFLFLLSIFPYHPPITGSHATFTILTWYLCFLVLLASYVCIFSPQENVPLFYYIRVGPFFLSLIYLYKMSKWMGRYLMTALAILKLHIL